MKEELVAFKIIKEKKAKEYNELYDSLYYYILTYLEDDMTENYLFKDEIENYIGLREHEEIINYILNLKGGEE